MREFWEGRRSCKDRLGLELERARIYDFEHRFALPELGWPGLLMDGGKGTP